MTPVCPACRTQVRLDDCLCPRCGLAMRPTCARCAEPLMTGMDACWRCGERVVEPEAPVVRPEAPVVRPEAPVVRAEAPVVRARAVAPSAPATVTAPIAVRVPLLEEVEHSYERPAPPVEAAWEPERRRSRGLLRWLFVAVTAGLLVVIGLLAFAMFGPTATQVPPEEVELEERVFTGLGLTIGLPRGWRVSEDSAGLVASDRRELFGRPVQGVSLALDDRRPTDMVRLLGSFNRGRVSGYEAFETDVDARIGGYDAVYHAFLDDDGLRYEQWWIEREGGSMWVEFWSRQVDDNAFVLHRRILESVERL